MLGGVERLMCGLVGWVDLSVGREANSCKEVKNLGDMDAH